MTYVVLETEVLFSQLADLSLLAHQLLGRATHCQLSRQSNTLSTVTAEQHIVNCHGRATHCQLSRQSNTLSTVTAEQHIVNCHGRATHCQLSRQSNTLSTVTAEQHIVNCHGRATHCQVVTNPMGFRHLVSVRRRYWR